MFRGTSLLLHAHGQVFELRVAELPAAVAGFFPQKHEVAFAYARGWVSRSRQHIYRKCTGLIGRVSIAARAHYARLQVSDGVDCRRNPLISNFRLATEVSFASVMASAVFSSNCWSSSATLALPVVEAGAPAAVALSLLPEHDANRAAAQTSAR